MVYHILSYQAEQRLVALKSFFYSRKGCETLYTKWRLKEKESHACCYISIFVCACVDIHILCIKKVASMIEGTNDWEFF